MLTAHELTELTGATVSPCGHVPNRFAPNTFCTLPADHERGTVRSGPFHFDHTNGRRHWTGPDERYV